MENELEKGVANEATSESPEQPTSRVTKRKSKRKHRVLLALLGIVIVIVSAFISLRIYAQIAGAPPLTVPKATVFLNAEGEQIGDHYTSERRYWVKLDNISPHIVDATIAVEDQNFYAHHGFNIKRIGAAVIENVKSGGKAQGASTLTQQYARNLYLSHEKTWTRKINEALYAYRLEVFYSKDEILEGYLNTVYYGHGMYGVEAASRFYFGKSANDLTLSEAAMLSGIPKGPTYYSPVADLERATNRQHLILKLMEEEGYITAEENQTAITQPVALKNNEWKVANSQAPYFLDTAWVEASAILEDLGLNIDTGGWEIATTLNKVHQNAAEKAVIDQMPKNALQIGFVSMNQKTGYITALVGGRSYADSKFNRVTQAKRQPGSTMKPLLYASALQHGYSPLTFVDVSQTTIEYDGKEYTPRNINGKYGDEISMAQAVAISDNVYAVKTLDDIGYKAFQRTLDDFKLGIEISHVPSSALGTTNLTLQKLTAAYATVANNGQAVTPTTIMKITDEHGNVLYEASPDKEARQVIPKKDAYLLTQMMTGMFNKDYHTYLYATGASLANKLTRPYAGKSGTTDADQWMIGYSPSVTAGVWNGFDEGVLDVTNDGAATKEVWTQFMESVHRGTDPKPFPAPSSVTAVDVEISSGKLANKHCTGATATVYVAVGEEPTKGCAAIDKYIEPKEQDGNSWWDWLNIFD